METKKKNLFTTGLAVALAALLLIGGGTFAYLQSSTGDTVNTFDTNKVMVELKETTGENYNIIPGTTQNKDPKVTVNNTVDAYVYVKVTDTTEGLVDYTIADGWTPLAGVDNVYYQEVSKGTEFKDISVLKGDKVTYSAALENNDMLDENGNLKTGIKLTFSASAVQKKPFNDPVKAFFQADTVVTLNQDAEVSALADAINAADGKTAIVVPASISTGTTINIPADKDIVLSLSDDAEIVSTNKNVHAITNNGTLTVKGGTIDAEEHAAAAVYNEVGATAVLENVTVTRSKEAGVNANNNGGNSYYAILNHGTMTLNNCNVSADGHYSSLIENGWQDGSKNTSQKASILTINGGTYIGGLNTIKNDDYSELTINGGVFKNDAQYVIMNYNIATVNGGDFTASKSSAVYNCYLDDTMDKGQLTIAGGNFDYNSGYYGIYDVEKKGKVTITDGKFVTQHITNKTGYTVVSNEDGTYSVEK